MDDKQPGSLRFKSEKELKRFFKKTGKAKSGDITTAPKEKVSELRQLEIRVEHLENESKVVAAQMRIVFGKDWEKKLKERREGEEIH